MIQFLILVGYFELMMHLMVTGNITKYINSHYQYLAVLSMILALLLALVQLFRWLKAGKESEHKEAHVGHDHQPTSTKIKILSYLLLSLPIFVSLLFPTVNLDASIVSNKGFHFPVSKESTGTADLNTQYLKPDTSIYYNQKDYEKRMNKELQAYKDQKIIQITDDNYMTVMELIYNYPSEFEGKQIQFNGFIYNDPFEKEKNIFVFRFGIVHCIADSGVYGLLIHLPVEHQHYEDNKWVSVTGNIHQEYYAPLKTDIPTVQVEQIKIIQAPEEEYVYRDFST